MSLVPAESLSYPLAFATPCTISDSESKFLLGDAAVVVRVQRNHRLYSRLLDVERRLAEVKRRHATTGWPKPGAPGMNYSCATPTCCRQRHNIDTGTGRARNPTTPRA